MFLQDDFKLAVGMKVKSKYYHNKPAPYRCASFKGHFYDAIIESIGDGTFSVNIIESIRDGTVSVKYNDSDSIKTEVELESLKFLV